MRDSQHKGLILSSSQRIVCRRTNPKPQNDRGRQGRGKEGGRSVHILYCKDEDLLLHACLFACYAGERPKRYLPEGPSVSQRERVSLEACSRRRKMRRALRQRQPQKQPTVSRALLAERRRKGKNRRKEMDGHSLECGKKPRRQRRMLTKLLLR